MVINESKVHPDEVDFDESSEEETSEEEGQDVFYGGSRTSDP